MEIREIENIYKQGNFKKVIEELTEQESKEALLLRGKAYHKIQDFNEAESDFTNALEKAKFIKSSEERETFRTTVICIRAISKASAGKRSEALSDLESLTGIQFEHLQKKIEKTLQKVEKSTPKKAPSAQEKEEFIALYREESEVKNISVWHLISSDWFSKWQKYAGVSLSSLGEFIILQNEGGPKQNPGIINNTPIIDEAETRISVIDNNEPGFEFVLKPGISENTDYFLVPERAFRVLESRYQCNKDIVRKSIEVSRGVFQVEVFLKKIKVIETGNKKSSISIVEISRKSTVTSLKSIFQREKELNGLIRLWKVSLNDIYENRLKFLLQQSHTIYLEGGCLIRETEIIDDAEIAEDDIIVFETKTKGKFLISQTKTLEKETCSFCEKPNDLTVRCKGCTAKYCSKKCRSNHLKEHSFFCEIKGKKSGIFSCICTKNKKPYKQSHQISKSIPKTPKFSNSETPPSLFKSTHKSSSTIDTPNSEIPSIKQIKTQTPAGLKNLGNTCYMNAALQCLFHTEKLSNYFLSKNFAKDINKNNPLGSKGKVAHAYNDLVRQLTESNRAVAPWDFKKTLSKFAPEFSGYQQHDSHELLSYLLDGLHEDLNKVKKKPFFKDDDALKGKPDHEAAAISWERHYSRNNSIIVDLMHGEYKSTIQCPNCQNFSYAYDPFSCLSLPLSEGETESLQVQFVFEDPKISANLVCIEGDIESFVELRKKLASIVNVPARNFVLTLVQQMSILKIIDENEPLSNYSSSSIFAYEISSFEMIPIELKVAKSNSQKIAYPRLILAQEEDSLEDIYMYTNEKMRTTIGKTREIPYRLFLSVESSETCPICSRKSCSGCELPEENKPLASILSAKMLRIELRFKSSLDSLEIRQFDLNRHRMTKSKAPRSISSSVSIYQCFQAFSVPEKLDEDNSWYCPSCKSHVEAVKKFEIYRVPEILVIHLKRFKSRGFYREKLNIPVNFPLENLDISPYVLSTERCPLYDLYAVSNHFGNLGSGHYTSNCMDQGTWFNFDDSVVSVSRENLARSAYVLFYKANNLN